MKYFYIASSSGITLYQCNPLTPEWAYPVLTFTMEQFDEFINVSIAAGVEAYYMNREQAKRLLEIGEV